MTAVTIFSIVVLLVLLIGTIAIVRLDVRRAAGRTVRAEPRRTSWFVGSRAFIPVACLSVVAIVGTIGAIGSRVALGTLQQEANNTQAAVVTAAQIHKVSERLVLSHASTTSALVKLQSPEEADRGLQSALDNPADATDRDVRSACVQFISRATDRLASDPTARLQRTESRLIEYCLPKLQAEVTSPMPSTAPRRVSTEPIAGKPGTSLTSQPTISGPGRTTGPTITK